MRRASRRKSSKGKKGKRHSKKMTSISSDSISSDSVTSLISGPVHLRGQRLSSTDIKQDQLSPQKSVEAAKPSPKIAVESRKAPATSFQSADDSSSESSSYEYQSGDEEDKFVIGRTIAKGSPILHFRQTLEEEEKKEQSLQAIRETNAAEPSDSGDSFISGPVHLKGLSRDEELKRLKEGKPVIASSLLKEKAKDLKHVTPELPRKAPAAHRRHSSVRIPRKRLSSAAANSIPGDLLGGGGGRARSGSVSQRSHNSSEGLKTKTRSGSVSSRESRRHSRSSIEPDSQRRKKPSKFNEILSSLRRTTQLVNHGHPMDKSVKMKREGEGRPSEKKLGQFLANQFGVLEALIAKSMALEAPQTFWIASAAVEILKLHGTLGEFLVHMINREVQKTNDLGTLFRGKSVSTTVIRALLNSFSGLKYLQAILGSFFDAVEQLQATEQDVPLLCDVFLNGLKKTISTLPPVIRFCLRSVFQVVSSRDQKAGYTADPDEDSQEGAPTVDGCRLFTDRDFEKFVTLCEDDGDHWTVAGKKKRDAGEITIERRPCPKGKYFDIWRVKGAWSMDDVSIEDVLCTLQDGSYRKNWDTNCKRNGTVKFLAEANELGFYEGISPSPLSNRDFCTLKSWRYNYPKEGNWVLVNHSVEHESVPEVPGVIRGTSFQTGNFLRIDEDARRIYVTYVTQSDVKGWIPQFVINMVTSMVAPGFIDNIEKAAKGYKQWCEESGSEPVCNRDQCFKK